MQLRKIKIGKREFELAYPVFASMEIAEQIPGFDLTRVREIVGGTKPSKEMLIVLTALARYGAIVAGKEFDVDMNWFGAHIPCSFRAIVDIQVAIFDTITDWSMMETEETDPDEEIDVVLRDIKKKERAGS